MSENIVRKSIRDTVKEGVETYCRRDNLTYQEFLDLLAGIWGGVLSMAIVKRGGTSLDLQEQFRITLEDFMENSGLFFETASALDNGADPDLLETMGNA